MELEVGKRLQTQSMSGVTLEDILKKQYPDIHFEIKQNVRSPGGTTIFMWKKCANGSKAVLTLTMTPDLLQNVSSDLIKDMLEEGVRKLRDYCSQCPDIEKNDNPSSRWYA